MSAPPTIFSAARRVAIRRRMRALQAGTPGAARYLLHDMIEDVCERLQFLRHEPARVLVIGDWSGEFAREASALWQHDFAIAELHPEDGFDEEMPLAETGFDLIVSLGTLDTVNDLPGALIHLRSALAAAV